MKLFAKKKSYSTLAIIGNGFDLAHGYNTTYKSFVQNTQSDFLDEFKSYCDNENFINTWYSFEENINFLSRYFFEQMYTDEIEDNYENINNEISRLNELFTDIHRLLLEYLKNEVQSKPIKVLSSVKKHLNADAQIINFNYTNTAERYSKNVFYVHGSIVENDILLGYDYRDEPCLAQYNNILWSKILCREKLAYRRFLKDKLHMKSNSKIYKKLIRDFESYQETGNSGKGVDASDITYIHSYYFIKAFMNFYENGMDIPRIDYNKIEKIVILGHGIEADKVFLDNILKKCHNLKEVIIFRYDGESDSSYDSKADFFKKYSANIKTEFYT